VAAGQLGVDQGGQLGREGDAADDLGGQGRILEGRKTSYPYRGS
jgi:hypothetical protein